MSLPIASVGGLHFSAPPGETHCYLKLEGGAPIGLRPTRDALYLVGTAQGLVGDDQLELDVLVKRGAELRVRSAAATIAYASNGAMLHYRCRVEQGATLDWRPEPVIATKRCSVTVRSTVSIESGGTVRWREEAILGRRGEGPGNLDLSLVVDHHRTPLVRHQLIAGSRLPGWDGPSGIGRHRFAGYELFVGEEIAPVNGTGPGWCRFTVGENAVVSNALADDFEELRRRLKQASLGSCDAPDDDPRSGRARTGMAPGTSVAQQNKAGVV